MPARSVCLVTLSPSEAGPGRFGRQQSSIPPPLSLSLALSLALALVLAPPPSLSLSVCVCAFCCVCTVHVPSFYPIPLPLSLLSLQLACLRLPAVKMHPTSRWYFSTPPIDLRRCLLRTQAAAFVCPPPRPLLSLPLFLSVCCARAHACVHMCVRCVCMCWSVCNSACACACACACVCVCVFQPRIGRLFRVSTLSGGEEHGGAGHLWQAISWMIGCCENNKD